MEVQNKVQRMESFSSVYSFNFYSIYFCSIKVLSHHIIVADSNPLRIRLRHKMLSQPL